VDFTRPVCCKQAEARDQEKCLKKLNEEAEQEWFHKSHSDDILVRILPLPIESWLWVLKTHFKDVIENENAIDTPEGELPDS